MAFKRFTEFLSEQNKGKMPGSAEPEKAKNGKLPTQYHAKGANQDRGLVTADDDRGAPLGEKGMSGMEPKKVMPYGQKPAGAPKKLKMSKGKMPKKIKTEAFLNHTSELSNAEFTAAMMENTSIPKPKLTSLDGRQFTPEPAETMRYVVALALKNENLMSRLVREVRRNGGLEKLVAELFSHNETFAIIAEAASENSRINRKLNEAVAEPRGMGGAPAGPNGATAGNGPIVKNGGGMGAAPPGPPSEGEENPDHGGNLLDDEEGGGEEDDNEGDDDENGILDGDMDHDDDEDEDDEDEEDDEDDKGKHTHIHIHNHHGDSGGDMGGMMGGKKGGGMKL